MNSYDLWPCRALVFSVALTLVGSVIAAEPLEYTSTGSDVSFDSVFALTATPADARLVYGAEQPDLQYGLLWLPSDASEDNRAPLVIFIHGGCWLNAYDIEHARPLASALATAGFAVWSIEYRRTGDPGGGWPGTFEDIVAGIDYVRTLTGYPIDQEHTSLAGHSAGGHLAALAGAQFPELDAVIGLAAITNIDAYARGTNSCQTATPAFMGTDPDSNPDLYRTANVAVQPLHSNTILLHGDRDTIVPEEQSFVPNTERHLQVGAGHFDWVHPGTLAFRLLLDQLRARTGP